MNSEHEPKLNTRRLSVILFWLLLLVAVTLIVLSLIPGRQPGRNLLSEIFTPRTPIVTVSELSFDIGRDRVFAHSGGFVAAVGSLGLQVLGSDGTEVLRDSFRCTRPSLVENSGHFLAFDIGGSALRVFNAARIISSIETEGIIVSASINKNGWFCLVSQEHNRNRGTIAIFDNSGARVYQVNMGTGFALSAKVSDDNRNLTILSITDSGSRLTFYNGIDTDKEGPDHIYELGSEIFLDFEYIDNNNILAFSTNSVIVIRFTSGAYVGEELFKIESGRLGGYTHCDFFVALHIYDYGIGYSGQIITLGFDGAVLGALESSIEVVSMASYGKTLILLSNDGVAFFNELLREYPAPESNVTAAAASRVIALSEDMALAASDHSAIIIRLH